HRLDEVDARQLVRAVDLREVREDVEVRRRDRDQPAVAPEPARHARYSTVGGGAPPSLRNSSRVASSRNTPRTPLVTSRASCAPTPRAAMHMCRPSMQTAETWPR